MKPIHSFLFSAALLVASLLPAEAEPLAQLTVRSHGELQKAIAQFAQALNPKADMDFGQAFSSFLGLTAESKFDAQRPWQMAVWYEGGATAPFLALKVPVADIAQFKAGLNAEGLLRKQGQVWTQLTDAWGLISLRELGNTSEAVNSSMDQWKTAAVQAPPQALHLTVNLNEPVRNQILATLARAKDAMTEVFATNQALTATGSNPQMMGQMFEFYFGLYETAVKGLGQLRLGFDLRPDTLVIDEVVTALPNSELAGWLRPQAGRLTAQDLAWLDPQALVSAAAFVDQQPSTLAMMQQFLRLGFQIQNIPADDPLVKEMESMLEKMFPMSVSFSVGWKDELSFAGAYGFPKANAAALYAQMKNVYRQSVQRMVGDDKMYAAADLKENHRVIGEVAIDRFSLTLNTNNPLFSLPGQKEQFHSMWPDGKLEFEYALKGNQLLFASPGRMPALLTAAPSPASQQWAATLEPNTVLAGRMNLIGLIQKMVGANPMMPAAAKEPLARLDPAGTDIAFRASVAHQLHARAEVPMKLFREFGAMSRKP